MQIELIRSDSAPERVVKQILANLKSGDMKPGDRLPAQEKLAEQFGVGRSSIREAMNALAIMGYVKIVQGKGSFINEPGPAESPPGSSLSGFLEDADPFNLVEIREILECYVVQKAAERGESKQLHRLGDAIGNLRKCAGDREKFLKRDLNFHLAVANAANLPEAGEITRLIHGRINSLPPVAFSTSKTGAVIEAIETAERVYRAILRGDGVQAARHMRNHLDAYAKALKRAVQRAVTTRPAETPPARAQAGIFRR